MSEQFRCKCKMYHDTRFSNNKHREETKCTCSHVTQNNLCQYNNNGLCTASDTTAKPKCHFFQCQQQKKQYKPICHLTKEY